MATAEVPQRIQALAKANEIRLARAEVKARVADGRTTAAAVILEPPACTLSMTLAELLASQRRWGARRVEDFTAATGLSETKLLGDLTAGQRRLLVLALGSGQTARDARRDLRNGRTPFLRALKASADNGEHSRR